MIIHEDDNYCAGVRVFNEEGISFERLVCTIIVMSCVNLLTSSVVGTVIHCLESVAGIINNTVATIMREYYYNNL